MDVIFSDNIFKYALLVSDFDSLSLNYDLDCPTDNKSALVRMMTWRLLGAKLLPEPVMTEFNDACIQHQAAACWVLWLATSSVWSR